MPEKVGDKMTGNYRYLLLCRHARHNDGELVAVKGSDDVLRFPTESVAGALVEQVAFGGDDLRLAKALYARTDEARRTAAVLLRRLGGQPACAGQHNAGITGGFRRPAKVNDKPPQPILPEGPVQVVPPSWLPKKQWEARKKMKKIELEEAEEFLPSAKVSEAETRLKRELKDLGQDGNALVVVGHQPQLSCVASVFVRRGPGWVSRAVPIAPSEVVCLRLQQTSWHKKWRGRIVWTLVPDDSDALEEVTDKVRGKMESAKLLSAVITLVLTALLGILLDADRWNKLVGPKTPTRASLAGLSYDGHTAARIAFVMLLGALTLYLLTMYSYDRLLMPPRFWAEILSRRASRAERRTEESRRWPWRTTDAWLPRRPPSSAAWVVYRNMQRIWFCLFTPANLLVALALLILAGALLRLQGWTTWLCVAGFFIAVAIWWLWFRPVIGSED